MFAIFNLGIQELIVLAGCGSVFIGGAIAIVVVVVSMQGKNREDD